MTGTALGFGNSGKQWGATVSTITLDNNGQEVWAMEITDQMRDAILYEGQTRFSRANNPEHYQGGINIDDGKQAFTEEILDPNEDTRKQVETRNNRSLDAYRGQEVGLVSTHNPRYNGKATMLGWATVRDAEPIIWTDYEEFHRPENEALHHIIRGSAYDMKPGETKYGYYMDSPRREEPYTVTERGNVSRDVYKPIQKPVIPAKDAEETPVEKAVRMTNEGATPSQVYTATGLTVMANGAIRNFKTGETLWGSNNALLDTGRNTLEQQARGRAVGAVQEYDGRGTTTVDSGKTRRAWSTLAGGAKRILSAAFTRVADETRSEELKLWRDSEGDEAVAQKLYEAWRQGDVVLESYAAAFPNVEMLKEAFIDATQGNETTRHSYSDDEIPASIAELKAKYRDSMQYLFMHTTGRDIHLDNVVVKPELRNQKVGTRFMKDLIAYADAHDLRILVTPTSEYGTQKQLTNWYKRFGFSENKGSKKDYSILDTMYRTPALEREFPRAYSRFAKADENGNIKNPYAKGTLEYELLNRVTGSTPEDVELWLQSLPDKARRCTSRRHGRAWIAEQLK